MGRTTTMCFDNMGRVLCVECAGSMRVIDAKAGEALFLCTNKDCNHSVVFRWPALPAVEQTSMVGDRLAA